jgi:hypothetical protein
MKKNILTKIFTISAVIILLAACKKDYITGGVPEDINKYKDVSSYDVLKTNTLYDTLLMLIDTAGIRDKVNLDNSTYFAPSDYSIFSYLNQRTLFVQARYGASKKFGLDSLFYYLRTNQAGTRDSMLMYLIKEPLMYNSLTDVGKIYTTELTGHKAIVSYEYTRDGSLGYNSNISTVPQVVYFSHLWYPYDLSPANPAGKLPNTIGVRTLVKTSCIKTRNGVLNSLDNSHTLFFYGTKK